jgi:hypothetical protein
MYLDTTWLSWVFYEACFRHEANVRRFFSLARRRTLIRVRIFTNLEKVLHDVSVLVWYVLVRSWEFENAKRRAG